MTQLPAVPPKKPPSDQNPWLEDMIARPSRRSTSTALAFIATSMQPISAPKAAIASASIQTEGEKTTSGNTGTTERARRAGPARCRSAR